MRRVLMTALATAAILGLSSAASAAVTLTDTTGTPLDNQIFGIAGDGTTVFGSSPNNDGIANVTFTADTTVHMGAGFAQINDATPNDPNWFSLIINPDLDFTDFKFSTQLVDDGTIEVFYLLAGGACDADNPACYTLSAGSYSADNNNLNKLLSGATFDGLRLVSSAPIAFFEVKQMTFNGVTGGPPVPEPATWAMMLLGFGGIGMAMRRSRKSNGRLLQIA
jgi:PEP-CTERM motif-containing protein